jgi:MYND finger
MENATSSANNSNNSSSGTCSFCGIVSCLSLKRCSRCKITEYCTVACQKNAWPSHKMECCRIIGADAAATSTSAERSKATSTFLRQCKRQGTPIFYASMTAYGIVMPGMVTNDARIPRNFGLKQQATLHFMEGPSRTGTSLGNLRYEASYRDYYHDLIDETNGPVWMSFFQHPDNAEHAEHTCGILGNLAVIYRRRGGGEYERKCEEVLDLWQKVFDLYKAHGVYAPNVREHAACADALEFKTNIVRYNLMYQTQRYEECVAIYPILFLYECNYNVSFDNQSYLFMIEAILRKTPPISAATIRSLTHDEIMRIVLAPLQNDASTADTGANDQKQQAFNARLSLPTCAGCQLPANAVDHFKKCPRCHTNRPTFYCGKQCQKKDWKVHKKICGKSASS